MNGRTSRRRAAGFHRGGRAPGFRILAPLALAALLGAGPATPDDWEERLAREIPAVEDVVVAESASGVVATLHEEASRAAVQVLEDGGNAMDAAAAAWLVLSVVTPNQTGLGGGGHINYYDAETGQTYVVDAAQRAGVEAHPGIFLAEDGEPLETDEIRARGLAVGVPGVVRGFDVALKRWGTREWEDLAEPAVRLAEDGWEVDRELSLRIHQTQEHLGEHARAVYMPEGKPLEPGDLLVQEAKARALRLIAEEGAEAFYQGPIAEAAAEYVRSLGGVLTVEDFMRYNVTVDPPLWLRYGDYQVATHPNIPGGYTIALMLRLLEPFELGGYPVRSPERYHLLMEATRIASATANGHIGGPEFVDHAWQGILADAFVEANRAAIRPDHRIEEVETLDPWEFQAGGPYRTRGHHPEWEEPGPLAPEEGAARVPGRTGGHPVGSAGDPAPRGDYEETDHLTIVDRHGNVVAVTTSLGVGWLGGHMVPEYGFMLNVRGAYFDTEPGGVQEVRPGKRPRRSMTPTIVFRDGEPILTVGSPSPGGMQHVQVMLNVLEHGMGPAEAVAEPRVAPPGIWEDGVPAGAREALAELGHPMDEEWSDRGAVSIVLRDGDRWLGAADPRRDGVAMAVPDGARAGEGEGAGPE